MHHAATPRQVIARLAREVGRAARYPAVADFKDALRCRLAQLHIPYAPVEFDAAIAQVASNTRLWDPALFPGNNRDVKPVESPPLSAAEASAVLAQLRHRVRTMPRLPAAPSPDWTLALRQVLDAVAAQTARVADLEARDVD